MIILLHWNSNKFIHKYDPIIEKIYTREDLNLHGFKTSRVCIMTSSDYITLKKYKNMRNIFTTKESGNNIQKLKINTILNGYRVDEYYYQIPW